MYKICDKIEKKLEYILKHSLPNDLIENLKLFVEIETIDVNISKEICKNVYNLQKELNHNLEEIDCMYYYADDVDDLFDNMGYLSENLTKLCEKFDTNLLTLQLENKLMK